MIIRYKMIKAREKLQFLTVDEMVKETFWIEEIDKCEADDDEKIDMIIKAIECPKEYHDLFKALVDLIQSILHKKFGKKSKVLVSRFGSSVTNLALKTCDLDIAVEFDPPVVHDTKLLNKLKNALLSFEKEELFTKIIIIKARVSILRCWLPIALQCDISACNLLAIRNSALIKFFVSLNKRFRSLILLIKLWFKRRSSQGTHFKGYLISLMVVFFLQQKNLLPSVLDLQKHSESSNKSCVMQGWSCYFCDDPSYYDHISNQDLQLFPLVQDFFNFYSTFEFGMYVISPYRGEKILKTLETYLKNVKREFSYVTVQDAFQLDFSTSSHVCEQALSNFQDDCQRVVDKLAENKSKPAWSLLFSKHESKRPKKKKKSQELFVMVGHIELDADSEDEFRDKWTEHILTIIEEILRHAARLDVKKNDGVFICKTVLTDIFHKKLRSKVMQELKPSEYPDMPLLNQSLRAHVAVSEAIAKESDSPTCKLVEFCVTYKLQTSPTKLQFNVDSRATDENEFRMLHSFRQCFAQFISLI